MKKPEKLELYVIKTNKKGEKVKCTIAFDRYLAWNECYDKMEEYFHESLEELRVKQAVYLKKVGCGEVDLAYFNQYINELQGGKNGR